MIKDLKFFVNYLTEHNMTANQYTLIQCLLSGSFAELCKFSEILGGRYAETWQKEIDDLFTRGYLTSSGSNPYDGTMLAVTDKVYNSMKCGYEQAVEFWDAYPTFIMTDKGERLFLKNTSQSHFLTLYLNEIMYDLKRHQRMMQILDYASGFGFIRMKINMFIEGKVYKAIEKEMYGQN